MWKALAAGAFAATLLATAPALALGFDLGTLGPGASGSLSNSWSYVPHEGGTGWSMDWSKFGHSDPVVQMDVTIDLDRIDYPAIPGFWHKYDRMLPGWGYDSKTTASVTEIGGHLVYKATILFSNLDRSADRYIAWFESAGGDFIDTTGEIHLDYSVSPVPLPAAGALFASAIAMAGCLRRRKAV